MSYALVGEKSLKNVRTANFVFITARSQKLIAKQSNWVHVRDYAKQQLAQFSQAELDEYFSNRNQWANSYRYLADLCPEVKRNLSAKSNDKLEKAVSLAQKVGVAINFQATDEREAFHRKYPLVEKLSWLNDTVEKEVRFYIQKKQEQMNAVSANKKCG